jgi:hypothetical protein
MARKTKEERTLIAHDGREIKRPFATLYWTDNRRKEPTPFCKGFPKNEDGSIAGAGKIILRGLASKIKCVDRLTGRVRWTVTRGERVPGTNIYSVVATKGDADG